MATTLTEAEVWPLDYEALQKGDSIPVEKCEEVIGKKQTDPTYWAGLLSLRDRVERDMAAIDKPVVVRSVGGLSLRVLTDADATEHLGRTASQTARKMCRTARKLATNVDAAKLTREEQHHHARRVCVVGQMALAMKRGKREAIKMLSHKRTVPGLPKPA